MDCHLYFSLRPLNREDYHISTAWNYGRLSENSSSSSKEREYQETLDRISSNWNRNGVYRGIYPNEVVFQSAVGLDDLLYIVIPQRREDLQEMVEEKGFTVEAI